MTLKRFEKLMQAKGFSKRDIRKLLSEYKKTDADICYEAMYDEFIELKGTLDSAMSEDWFPEMA